MVDEANSKEMLDKILANTTILRADVEGLRKEMTERLTGVEDRLTGVEAGLAELRHDVNERLEKIETSLTFMEKGYLEHDKEIQALKRRLP